MKNDKTEYIIIAATQVQRNLFAGTLDELNEIANAGDSAVFQDGSGWFYQLGTCDEPHLASSQLAAICAVLGDDTHFFRCITEEEGRRLLAGGGFKGHFGIEATGMLREHFENMGVSK